MYVCEDRSNITEHENENENGNANVRDDELI